MISGKIDHAALKRLLDVVGNDVDELDDLRSDYLEDAPALARRIAEAASQGDLTALRIAAHTLKANARDFGAAHLAELCASLEQLCRNGGPEDPGAVASNIMQEEEAVRRTLSNLRLAGLAEPDRDT